MRLQFFYIITVFVPYMWIFERSYDIWAGYSLSRIGWRPHIGGPNGVWFLIGFLILTCPFMVYQVWFYLRNSGHKSQKLLYMSIVSALFLATSAAMPYDRPQTETPLLHALHNGFAVLGALSAVLVLTIILARVCRESHREIILVLYALFAFAVFLVYTTTRNAAAFQIGMTFTIFVIMYFINRAIIRRSITHSSDKNAVSESLN